MSSLFTDYHLYFHLRTALILPVGARHVPVVPPTDGRHPHSWAVGAPGHKKDPDHSALDVNSRNRQQRTALMQAAKGGRPGGDGESQFQWRLLMTDSQSQK